MLDKIMNYAEKLGKTDEDVENDFEEFKENYLADYEGNLQGEKLVKRIEMLFLQEYRSKIFTQNSSPAKPVTMFVTGVTRKRDVNSWKRNECIKNYVSSPTNAVNKGFVDEYKIVDNKITKRSYDLEKKVEIEEEVVIISNEAELVIKGTYVAPRDNKKSFGYKENPNYGKEIPKNIFEREVHGVAYLDDDPKQDVKKFTLKLRGSNTELNKVPVPGLSYKVRVLNQNKPGSEEYSFVDSPTVTNFIKVNWNPYDGENFIENVLNEKFMEPYVRTLGDLKELAKKELEEKDENRQRRNNNQGSVYIYQKFNYCYFCEAEIKKMVLNPPDNNKGSRVTLDDESLYYDLESEGELVTGWLSDSAVEGLDTGENSRAILCCYPRMTKGKDNRADSFSLDVFGVLSMEDYKTNFDKANYIKINNLDEIED
jgi:hypothetical protein